jgi:transglutaminase-like putative cysteine protease
MIFAITHLTTYLYDDAISDSVMEVRLQPRTDDLQRCLRFDLRISPKARPLAHQDYLGNVIHHFDIHGRHRRMAVRAESLVEIVAPPPLPDVLSPGSWAELEAARADRDLFDMLLPSHFARPGEMLEAFMRRTGITREADPLTTACALNSAIYNAFDYKPNITRVDSPIADALISGVGVCQDFAHVMIAAARLLGIPARYVSGYLYHRAERGDRSADDATHAWVECWLPEVGWYGFDPTNNLICADSHIRVAVGRDYADVPPTKGVFLGEAESVLDVSVKVTALAHLPTDGEALAPEIPLPQFEFSQQQQQQ